MRRQEPVDFVRCIRLENGNTDVLQKRSFPVRSFTGRVGNVTVGWPRGHLGNASMASYM